MSRDEDCIDKYREDFESMEQWELRKAFILRWKDDYPEDRLLCLARVFVNMEFMGCRYPPDVMKEVAGLSEEIAKDHRKSKKGKLQRTFVSASDAAEDRAKGVKRTGGLIHNPALDKKAKINFVPQGHSNSEAIDIADSDEEKEKKNDDNIVIVDDSKRVDDIKKVDTTTKSEVKDNNEYLREMEKVNCLDVRSFRESMFFSPFGRFVLLIRPWTSRLGNIQASCAACRLIQSGPFENGCFTLTINNTLVAKATGANKAEAKSVVETLAWNRLRTECVSVLIKQQWIAQDDARITSIDVGKRSDETFGTPIESSRATKMMKLMGWTGGGLGAEEQGIAEPIKPHLQMVNRAGLGHSNDTRALRRSSEALMRRYLAADCPDVDLVFSSQFTKEERGMMHQIARRFKLNSTSYGKDEDRFLVVKKKLDPYSIVRMVIEKGGETPKYQVFLPTSLRDR